jgi:hypothetical protein
MKVKAEKNKHNLRGGNVKSEKTGKEVNGKVAEKRRDHGG